MKKSLSTLLILLSSSSIAYAESRPYAPVEDDIEKAISKTIFTKVDTNKDGKVSFDEVFAYRTKDQRKMHEARANEMISECDKNKDGKIDRKTELSPLSFDDIDIYEEPKEMSRCNVPEEIIDSFDLNDDGFITKEEFVDSIINTRNRPPVRFKKKIKAREAKRRVKFQNKQFTRCDKDKDEYLTLREAASMRCNISTEIFDAKDKNGDALISRQEMAVEVDHAKLEKAYIDPRITPKRKYKMPPLISLEMKISTCDKNENGKLELSETTTNNCETELSFFNTIDRNGDRAIDRQEMRQAHMKKNFDRMDKNKDGFLDKKEFKGSEVRYL